VGYTNQGFEIKIQGLEQLRKKLDVLGKTGVKRAMRPALRAGQKVITKAAQAAAPVRTGLVQRNIKTRAIRRSRKHFGMRTVLGEGFYKGKTFYGAFQEFGWKTGSRKHDPSAVSNRYVRSLQRRQIPGKHFMEKAAKANARAVGDLIVNLAAPDIEAEAAKRG
jgi:HK97 gp10 family phage protein